MRALKSLPYTVMTNFASSERVISAKLPSSATQPSSIFSSVFPLKTRETVVYRQYPVLPASYTSAYFSPVSSCGVKKRVSSERSLPPAEEYRLSPFCEASAILERNMANRGEWTSSYVTSEYTPTETSVSESRSRMRYMRFEYVMLPR